MQRSGREAKLSLSRVGIIAVCLLGLAIVPFGLVPAVVGKGSGDFQWSGARLLLHGVSPFSEFLSGADATLVGNQNPNYLHLLYLVLLPVGALPFSVARVVWALFNLAMAGVAVVVATRSARLGWWGVAGVAGLLASSGPFVVALANGQQTLMVMGMSVVAIAWSRRASARGVALALAMTKYSFAPVAAVLLVRGPRRVVWWAAATSLAAWLVFSLMAHSPLRDSATGPVQVGRTMAKGSGDLMTLSGMLLHDPRSFATYVAALVGAAVLLWFARGIMADGHVVDALSVGFLISLITFPHLVYDHSVLLFALVSGLMRSGPVRVWVLAVVGLSWFPWMIGGSPLAVYQFSSVLLTFTLLLSVLVALVLTRPVDRDTTRRSAGAEDGRLVQSDAGRLG